MILILSEPTEKDIELVKKILADKTISVLQLDALGIQSEPETPKPDQQWLSPAQFENEMNRRGYQCKTSRTRRLLCDKFGITYQMRGKELWFENRLTKVPSRL